jgi:hypothetical protein
VITQVITSAAAAVSSAILGGFSTLRIPRRGQLPPDAARYGFKTGSAAEWAEFMTKLAGSESSYRAKLANVSALERTANPAGSHGLFQLSPSDATTYGIRKTLVHDDQRAHRRADHV